MHSAKSLLKLRPPEELLASLKLKASELSEIKFVEDLEDDTIAFEYFLNVNKLILTFALLQIEGLVRELQSQRREALENYEDDLFDDLILEQLLVEQKALEAI